MTNSFSAAVGNATAVWQGGSVDPVPLLEWLTIGYIVLLVALVYPFTVLVRKARKYRKSISRKARSTAANNEDHDQGRATGAAPTKDLLLPTSSSADTCDISKASSEDTPPNANVPAMSPDPPNQTYVSPTLPLEDNERQSEEDLIGTDNGSFGKKPEVPIELGRVGPDCFGCFGDADDAAVYVPVVLPVSLGQFLAPSPLLRVIIIRFTVLTAHCQSRFVSVFVHLIYIPGT